METWTFDAEITIPGGATYFNINCNGHQYTFQLEDGYVKAYDGATELTLKHLEFKIEDDPMGNFSSVLLVRAKFKDPDIQTDLDITFKQHMPTLKIGQIFKRLQKFKTYKETTDGEAKTPNASEAPDASDNAPDNTGGGGAIALRL